MIPVRLSLTNFLSYRSTQQLDFSAFDLAVLSGLNGVGKSSLLEAITWSLWEQARAGSSDDLVNQDQQGMRVEFIFEHEGGLYRVLRKRDRKKRGGATTLEFQVQDTSVLPEITSGVKSDSTLVQWQSLTEGTIRQTQEKIISALRLSYDLFVNSSYLRQGHADEFTVKPPAQRKEILAEILGLALYDKLEEKAKEQRKQAQTRLEVINLQSQEMAKSVENRAHIAQNAQTAQNEKQRLKKTIKALAADQKKFQNESKQYELLNQQMTLERRRYIELGEQDQQDQRDKRTIEIEVKKLNELLREADQIKKEYVIYQHAQKELEDQNHKFAQTAQLKEALSVLQHKKAELEQTVKRIRNIQNCPTCLRLMSSRESEKVIEMLISKFKKADEPNLKKITSEIANIGFDKEKHQVLQKQTITLYSVITKYQELLVADNSRKEKQVLLRKLQDQISKNRQEAKKIAEQGIALKKQAEKCKDGYEKSQRVEKQLDDHRKTLSVLEGKIGELGTQLKQIYETQAKIATWQQESVTLRQEIGMWDDLAQAFSKKGIQTMIIEQTLPAIEEKANELLGRITDGRMKVQFVTQKAKKSAASADELIETLDILISDELGTRAYELYSGGEAFRINFAIRVALAKLLAVRSGAKLQFLVIDEGFGTLDAAGRDDIITAINSIRDDFKKIVVVSHVPELKDAFQSRIEITKDGDGSQINLLT